MNGRLKTPGVDRILLLAVLGLLVLGTLLVWSATSHRADLTGGDPTAYLKKQLVNVALGLVLVLTMGSTINGSRSWIDVGGMSIQPSEFAKLAVVIGMALIVAERTEGSRRRRIGHVDVLLMLAVAGVPALLILMQPDLGTMLVLSATVFGVLAVAGVARRWLVLLVAGGIAAATLVVTAGVLKPYQVDRFMAFTNPGLDPRGAGYNTTQARIAIGNGGLFGQGLFHGSQTRSGFVPEQHTDFVFTVAGEELGLLGAGVLIVLFGILLWRALLIAARAEDLFGRLAAAGIACWFGFQTFQNIGMCLGIMPVTGVPLPLVSYGGSSMFASLIGVGLLLNIQRRSVIGPSSRLPAPRVLAR